MVKESWLRYYQPGEEPAQFDRIVQSWDTANKASELSDYSVCTTWGVRDKSFYLLDVFRERLNYPDLKRKVFELVGRYSATTILIEDKASGTQLIQDLISEQMYGVQPHQPPSGTDKIMRLHTQTTMFANGHVLLPTIAPWLADYEKEILSFPGSRNDDQVDSPTQALAYMKRDRCPRHLEETRREPQLASFDAHTSPVTTVFRPLVPLALVGSRKTSVARVHQRQ